MPYSVADDTLGRWREYCADLDQALAQGRVDDALAAFMRLGGASEDDAAGARAAPFWEGLRVLAPTLAYDAAVLSDDGPPSRRLASTVQETLVLTRSTSDPSMTGLPVEFFAAAAKAVSTALPHVVSCTIEAPGHVVDAAAVAAPLWWFLVGQEAS